MSPITRTRSSMSSALPEKSRRVGTSARSRSVLLLATVAVTALFFILDSPARSSPNGSSSAEFFCYAAGLFMAVLYARFFAVEKVDSKFQKFRQQVDFRRSLIAVREHGLRKLGAARTKVRAFLVEILERFRSRWQLRPPQGPMFSYRTVKVVSIALVLMFIPLMMLPFLADMSGDALDTNRLLFFDAVPKRCSTGGVERRQGLSVRSTTWLVVAFMMSSGLCAVHPLQSGLLVAF